MDPSVVQYQEHSGSEVAQESASKSRPFTNPEGLRQHFLQEGGWKGSSFPVTLPCSNGELCSAGSSQRGLKMRKGLFCPQGTCTPRPLVPWASAGAAEFFPDTPTYSSNLILHLFLVPTPSSYRSPQHEPLQALQPHASWSTVLCSVCGNSLLAHP